MKHNQPIIKFILIFFVVIAVLGVFYILLKKADPNLLPSALLNKPAPVFLSVPLEGTPEFPVFNHETLKNGTFSVVNFWASWCAPCREEHPFLMNLKSSGITVYGINRKDDPRLARAFLVKYGNPYTAIIADPDGRVAIEWGGYGTPETFIISKQGMILKRYVGPIKQDTVNEIKALFQ